MGEKSCFNCKFYDDICCMFKCKCMAILDEYKSGITCTDHKFGKYDAIELDKNNYR